MALHALGFVTLRMSIINVSYPALSGSCLRINSLENRMGSPHALRCK